MRVGKRRTEEIEERLLEYEYIIENLAVDVDFDFIYDILLAAVKQNGTYAAGISDIHHDYVFNISLTNDRVTERWNLRFSTYADLDDILTVDTDIIYNERPPPA